MRSDWYQYVLISLGLVSTLLFGVFFYREIFPEYKIYQDDYIALEEFRSSYTHEMPPFFKVGVKQITQERSDKGNPVIDRCISCHVALQFPHFSKTKVGYDINGNLLVDERGYPVLVDNEDYIFAKLDQKIAELKNEKTNEELISQGNSSQVKSRLKEAERLKSLKTAKVGHDTYDVTKVLTAHPLIGRETRPFEYHPIEEYGCVSCHNGNGRGLTTEKAHGPIFDDQYEKEHVGHVPRFTEKDEENDPAFSRIFNGKPGGALLFQTTPLFLGALIQSKCIQCHQSSPKVLESALNLAVGASEKRKKRVLTVESGLENDKKALLSLFEIKASLEEKGLDQTIEGLKNRSRNYTLSPKNQERASFQLGFISKSGQEAIVKIDQAIISIIGSKEIADHIFQEMLPLLKENENVQDAALDKLLMEERSNPEATGTFFAKLAAIDLENQMQQHIGDIDRSLEQSLGDQKTIASMASDIDLLTYNYHQGQQLFISQACYACHRIAGLTRGGVGPELTQSGLSYPWFLKESIVWPQADLATSTMPNYQLDHEELEDLMTFLLAQVGKNNSVSETSYKATIQQWESGRKQEWEKPITPLQMNDVRYSMTVFAAEGCAACHRLQGFESDVGFRIEKQEEKPSFENLYEEKTWFKELFPEEITGSEIVKTVEREADEIDKRIVTGVRKGSILEEIEKMHPKGLEAFYTPFKFAARAKNSHYKKLIAEESDPVKKKKLSDELQQWKDRIHRVLLMFIQEYGFGRLVGPRPNWSGIFRSDEWLMEHFKNPADHVPRSIMPVFPFDETKFYALTRMLDVLGIRNRNANRSVWQHNGFNPEMAYNIYCSQCHGEFLQGNGPVALWIYPIPKNLRNSEFLRSLTKEEVVQSITHGVKGTPMPPWGEVSPDKLSAGAAAVLTKNEIDQLADWLFSSLPGATVIRGSDDVLKWRYNSADVISELQREGAFESIKDAAVIFDEHESLSANSDEKAYYISKQYYTPQNIEEGKAFFEMNCAVCHGKDADGSGMRAGSMVEAKPRMLTNFDWIQTRDDLRLLRSIKYGVPGTAMTPWGDLTNAFQRMQLVVYIRTLSEGRRLQSLLTTGIYQAFDQAEFTIERARMAQYADLNALQTEYEQTHDERENLYGKEGSDSKRSLELYQKELTLLETLKQKKEKDSLLQNLKLEVKAEREIYSGIGALIIQNQDQENLDLFVSLIDLLNHRFQFDDKGLSFDFSDEKEKKITELGAKIIENMVQSLANLEKEKKSLEAEIPSKERTLKLQEVAGKITFYSNLKNRLISGLAEGARKRQKEKELVVQYTAL